MTFKHLLVPLDGSHLAEAALPAAVMLAENLGAKVTLVHIIERGAPQEVHGEHHLTNPTEAHAYLAEVAQRSFGALPGIQVEQHVHTAESRDIAASIAEHGTELRPDMIIMCTHGSGGLRDVLYGSIAQQVVARGTTPVLLIRPTEAAARPGFACGRMLVPLDGNPDHETGLSAATELARACSAEVAMVYVVPTRGTLAAPDAAAGRLLPGTTRALLEMAEQDADQYLRARAARLQEDNVAVSASVRRGDPAAAIVEAAQSISADLIVLGTHGKAGTDAFWSGSITPKILGRSNVPLLLVPVEEA